MGKITLAAIILVAVIVVGVMAAVFTAPADEVIAAKPVWTCQGADGYCCGTYGWCQSQKWCEKCGGTWVDINDY